MSAKDINRTSLDQIKAAPAIQLVQGRKGWITTHDLVDCLITLEFSIEQFMLAVTAGYTDAIEKFEKNVENIL